MILNTSIIVITIGSVIIGVIRGFVKELAFMVGLNLGAYVAAHKYHLIEESVSDYISSPIASKIVSFLIIFLIVFFFFLILGSLLHKVIKRIKLGCFDRILGGILGIVRSAIIIWIMLTALLAFLPDIEPWIKESELALTIIEIDDNYIDFNFKN